MWGALACYRLPKVREVPQGELRCPSEGLQLGTSSWHLQSLYPWAWLLSQALLLPRREGGGNRGYPGGAGGGVGALP